MTENMVLFLNIIVKVNIKQKLPFDHLSSHLMSYYATVQQYWKKQHLLVFFSIKFKWLFLPVKKDNKIGVQVSLNPRVSQ